MSDADHIITIQPGDQSLDGGDGFDILDFGDLQGRTTSGFNNLTSSGGQIALLDPASGLQWTLGYVNFEGFQGSPYNDWISGNARTTYITGGAGDDTLTAQVMDTPLPITIYGGVGNDSIGGSELGDVLQGNQGADTVNGWEGNDWIYGGQGNDLLLGSDGGDNVNGNLGDDTVAGGSGADTLHGGQGNDSLAGADGDDYLSGDLGDDTMAGGPGADVFHAFAGGGADRITDFNAADGDTLRVDVGSIYSMSDTDAGALVSFAGGGSVLLVGVALNSLPPGWLVVG